MPINPFAFNLCPTGKLRWAIASLVLVAHLPHALAAGVVVAPGPGGSAQLQTQGGVPIVNIVAPNGAGLSHNQFLDYNVDRQGLVLNNALQAGQSQLAGQLAANPQFQGQAASVILNEVVSRNASAINGAQEIFGRAADYVLANPNGISVNGGSFINTPNASLVVGRPELNDGKLQALNSRDASGSLQIEGGGLRNGEGSINLIAPRIDSQGSLSARDQLNLTAGRNQVDVASGRVTAVDPGSRSSEQRIDASLFGAMQAGRINIVSTAQGAGVRVGPAQVAGRDGVQIHSAGDIAVSAQAAPNSLDLSRAGIRSSQGDVGLHSAQDLTLAAADVSGRDVTLEAGRNLTLSTVQSRKLQQQREDWSNSTIGITWETYERTTSDSQTREHASEVVASRDARLASGQNTELKAAKVEAGQRLDVRSGADLRLSAASESHLQSDQGKHRKHLWKADWDSRSEEQRSVATTLKGADIDLRSAALLRSDGAQLDSRNDIQLAAQQVEIGSAVSTRTSTDNRYAGDLTGGSFFGKTGDADQGQARHQGSRINASGKLIVKAADVRISGSQVRGGTEASVISDNGSLLIDGVQNSAHSNRHDKDSKAFGIVKDETRQASKNSSTVRSELVSDSNLVLKSSRDIAVTGAELKAAGALSVEAGGDVLLLSAQDHRDGSTHSDSRGFSAYAKENSADAGQYRAGVHYAGQQHSTSSSDVTQQGTRVSGASVQIAATDDLTLKGAQVASTAGDTHLSGSNVALLAEQDSYRSESATAHTGGGVYLTGGLDRAGAGLDFAHATTQDSHASTTAKISGVQSSGDLSIKAGALASEGAQVKAAGDLSLVAGQVDNRAARNTEHSSHQQSEWSADAGLNVEYKDIARPIAGAVQGLLEGKIPDKEALSNLGQPNLGVDLAVAHASAGHEETNGTAQVSQFSGSTVAVQVDGMLREQGTQYQASAGKVAVSAGQLVAEAASNSHSRSEQALDAKVDVRVYTTTGEDVNVNAKGAGSSSWSNKDSSQAVVAGYAGSQGVSIDVRNDARFDGSRVDGGQGGVAINAGGRLDLQAARDTQSTHGGNLAGGLNVSASQVSSEKSLEQGGKLGGSFAIGRVNETSQTQAGGQLVSQGAITLSGDALHLQGTQVQAGTLGVDAGQGGIHQESAQSTEQRSNWNVGLNAGGNLSRSTPTAADEKVASDYGFTLGAKVGVDYAQGVSQQQSEVQAGQVVVNSLGGVTVERRKDVHDQLKVDVDLGLGGKRTPPDDQGKLAGTAYTPTLKAGADYQHTERSEAGAGLAGAGQTEGGSLEYGLKAGLELPHKAADEAPKVSYENGQLNLGPVTLSGHFDSKQG